MWLMWLWIDFALSLRKIRLDVILFVLCFSCRCLNLMSNVTILNCQFLHWWFIGREMFPVYVFFWSSVLNVIWSHFITLLLLAKVSLPIFSVQRVTVFNNGFTSFTLIESYLQGLNDLLCHENSPIKSAWKMEIPFFLLAIPYFKLVAGLAYCSLI